MTIKKVLCFALACACVATVSAQSRRNARGSSRSAAEEAQDKMDAKVKISQMPSIGPQWGVYDMTYRTAQRWTEELPVNWYVLCDTSTAKQKDKSKSAKRLPPYVYYTLVTRYVNIPEGDHRSCVCLPPSFIERYGEPVVITCEIVTNDGKLLDGETVLSNIGKPFVAGKFTEETKDKAEWWANDEIINAKIQKGPEKGEALIEVRQGLVDRSKSPFYLVNNADYEAIQ